MMFTMALTGLQVVLLFLLADLIGGIVHWAEDTLGRLETPIWGRLFVGPNALHHERPAAMMEKGWLHSNALTFALAALFIVLVWMTIGLTWQLVLLGVFGGLNQQAHRFAHARRIDLPKLVIFLQSHKVLQDARHHWTHHKKPNNRYFCVMSPWLNPALERLGFWFALERVFVPIFGAPRRPDLTIYRWYRSRPIWDPGNRTPQD